VVSTALIALVTTPTVVCSSTILSTELRLLADARGTSSKEASAASSSSMDTTSSSVLASATIPSPPEKAPEAVALISRVNFCCNSLCSETVSAASISASSSSISSAAAPEELLLSL
jgi:hypothetical protein